MIIYLHGFNSSPASHKARLLQGYLEERGLGDLFRCPSLPPHAADALRSIEASVRDIDPKQLTFVGSSLGGLYATWYTERLGARAVLINPAVEPHIGLQAALGPQRNLYTGERYELRRHDLEVWRSIVLEHIDPERYLLLLETGDEVLDWRAAARKYEGARSAIRGGGDHSLQSFREHLPRILAFAGIAAAGRG